MDRLEEMLALQAQLNARIRRRPGMETLDSDAWMQKFAIALIAEVAEALDETNYKWWKNRKAVNMPALKEELVDVLHFFLSMCLEAGMGAEEIYRIYKSKCEENFARQDGKSAKAGYDAPGGMGGEDTGTCQ